LEEISIDVLSSKALEHSTKGLRSVAPGISRGLRLPGEEIPDAILAMDDFLESSATVSSIAPSSDEANDASGF
jgi:antiviral helicase SKI2